MMNLFRKNNNNLREEYAMDIFNDKDSIVMTHSMNEINENGFIFEKNSFVVAQYNCAIALSRSYSWDNFSAPVITVDYLFTKLSAEAQKFIIAHEIGHFINGYVPGREEEDEMAADAYAVDKCGKEVAIAALEETLSLLKQVSPNYNGLEFTHRIEKIKAM